MEKIFILSEKKQNLFLCYKLAKLTQSEFKITNPVHKIKLNLKDVDIFTNYDGSKNASYILILSENIEDDFANKMFNILDDLKKQDPDYKSIILINCFVSSNPNRKFNIQEPYVFASCNTIQSLGVCISDDSHVQKIIDTLCNMLSSS
jgi:hypothetical protein